jgi:hypothetical protein
VNFHLSVVVVVVVKPNALVYLDTTRIAEKRPELETLTVPTLMIASGFV